MEPDELLAFRQALLSLRQQTVQLSAEHQETSDIVTLDQARIGRLSRIDALQAQQMAKETERRRQLKLQRIDGALRRLDTGEYGYCLGCDEEIAVARLEVDPASTHCIKCADG